MFSCLWDSYMSSGDLNLLISDLSFSFSDQKATSLFLILSPKLTKMASFEATFFVWMVCMHSLECEISCKLYGNIFDRWAFYLVLVCFKLFPVTRQVAIAFEKKLLYICSILIAHLTIFSFHLILGSNSSAIETRLCVVGKENGENKNLTEAIQVNKEEMFLVTR